MRIVHALALPVAAAVLAACGAEAAPPVDATSPRPPVAAGSDRPSPSPAVGGTPTPTPTPTVERPDLTPTPRPRTAASEPPDWLGTRVLPRRDDGFGQVLPTPPELRDRRLVTRDLLPPPEGEDFVSSVAPVPDEVLARSTWSSECPVDASDLRYVTVAFWGFDGRPHTGELLVHEDAAQPLVEVFGRLFEARFPLEEMRIVGPDDLDAPPTGDGNDTTAFVCRPVRGSGSWSQHAYGLAIDINPFHNPYQRDDLVLPELASAYTDRSRVRPGMITEGSGVVEAFAEVGWGWGGAWTDPTDPMHFSANGR